MKKLIICLSIVFISGCCKIPRDYPQLVRNSATINSTLLSSIEYQQYNNAQKVEILEQFLRRDIDMFESISTTLQKATE